MPSLAKHLEVVGRTHGVPIRLDATDVGPLDADAEHALFRIAQEAVTNAVRHAEAHAIVRAPRIASDDGIVLAVEDDGQGFDPERPRDQRPPARPRVDARAGRRARRDAAIDVDARRGARPSGPRCPCRPSDRAVIRVVVVDDHPVVREGLALVPRLARRPRGRGRGGRRRRRGRASRRELAPDVVLLDLVLPGGGGVAALPRLLALDPAPQVLILTSFGADEQALAAVRAGASGWLGQGRAPGRARRRHPHRPPRRLRARPRHRRAGCSPRCRSPGGGDPGLDQLTPASARCSPCSAWACPTGTSRPAVRRREDGQDARVGRPGQAPAHRPHPGRAVRRPPRPGRRGDREVLGPAAEAQGALGPMAATAGRPYRRGMTTTSPHRTRHRRLAGPRPRPRPLARRRRLGPRHRRTATPSTWPTPPTRSRAAAPSCPSWATSPTRPTAPTSPPSRRRWAGSTCSCSTPARSARARCPPWPTYASVTSATTLETNLVAQVGIVQALLPHLRPGRHRRGHHLRRGRRALRGVGRLRRRQGRARAARRDPRRRAPRPAGAAGRPRRHAHPDAPGRVPRRGHLRPAAARGRACPGCDALIDERFPSRPLPRRRRAGCPLEVA